MLTRAQFIAAAAKAAASSLAGASGARLLKHVTDDPRAAPAQPTRPFMSYPPRPAAGALLGYNAQDTFSDPALMAALGASGAALVRWQPAWGNVEDFATGRLSLDAATARSLSYCASRGIHPIAVAAYGPPFASVLELKVSGREPVPRGSYSFAVTGDLKAVVTPTDHVLLAPATALTGRSAYYGSLVAGVDLATNTLTLASATTVMLRPGATLTVNRLRYPALADARLDNPGVRAYLRYVQFLAEQIAQHHGSGYICLWNEYPWANDRWDSRAAFYDTVPKSISPVSGLFAIQAAALELSSLPSGVRLINGLSDKTGFCGVLRLPANLPGYPRADHATIVSTRTVARNVVADGIHPYGNNPEAQAWDPSHTDNPTWPGHAYRDVNPAVDSTTNFTFMKLQEDRSGTGLRMMATECGTAEADDTRQAVYLLRRVASLWGMMVVPVVYAFAEGNTLSVMSANGPRESYVALKRLTALVADLGGPGGEAASVPTLDSDAGLSWPLMTVGIYGAKGALLLVWQRTWAPDNRPWNAIAPPPLGTATFVIPRGVTAGHAVAPRGGLPVKTVATADRITISVGEDVVALPCTSTASSRGRS